MVTGSSWYVFHGVILNSFSCSLTPECLLLSKDYFTWCLPALSAQCQLTACPPGDSPPLPARPNPHLDRLVLLPNNYNKCFLYPNLLCLCSAFWSSSPFMLTCSLSERLLYNHATFATKGFKVLKFYKKSFSLWCQNIKTQTYTHTYRHHTAVIKQSQVSEYCLNI